MESDSIIACASCGSPLGIDECSAGDDVACGSCGAMHQIECLPDDDVTDEIVRPDESDRDPDEDAARVFGKSRDEAESEPTAEDAAGKAAEHAPTGRRSRGGLGRPVIVALILALGAAGTWEWYQHQLRERALLSRVTFLEERLVATSRKTSRSGDNSTSLVSLKARVAELDDSLSRMATHFRMHGANTLQMDQSLQGARDVLVRQERQMGKLGLKMVLLHIP